MRKCKKNVKKICKFVKNTKNNAEDFTNLLKFVKIVKNTNTPAQTPKKCDLGHKSNKSPPRRVCLQDLSHYAGLLCCLFGQQSLVTKKRASIHLRIVTTRSLKISIFLNLVQFLKLRSIFKK